MQAASSINCGNDIQDGLEERPGGGLGCRKDQARGAPKGVPPGQAAARALIDAAHFRSDGHLILK